MNNDDYGYFGKGTEGYIHYKQTFDKCFKNDTAATRSTITPHKAPTPQTKEAQESDRRIFLGIIKVCGVFCASTIFVLLVWLVSAVVLQ
jgi:hypothetical protein